MRKFMIKIKNVCEVYLNKNAADEWKKQIPAGKCHA
jgi:hypothetical protein